jgi:hypothetical protein
MIKILLPLLCLFAVAIADNTCNYQANGNFNSSILFSNNWYEIMFADNATQLLSACTRFVFTQTDCGDITYQYGYLEPGLDGNFISKTLTLKENCAGQFDVITAGQTGSVFILDFASDYNWIVIGDTNGDFLSVLSKNRQNLDGLDRGLDLAAQYSLNSQHLDLQVSQCPYSRLLAKLKTARSS